MADVGSRPDAVDPIELGRRLRDAREFLGLSQEQVADFLGMPRPSVSAMEAGKRRVSFQEMNRIAQLYRRPLSYFSGDDVNEGDATSEALFRATQDLSSTDREQVLRFAQFLRNAGPAKPPPRNRDT
jgi:transcriptional regulator with XRE-family HTH domain